MFALAGSREGRSAAAIERLAGGPYLIQEVICNGSPTTVSFTDIPTDFRDLELWVRGRGTKAATLVDIRLRYNGDTGGNYDNMSVQGNNASIAVFGTLAQTSNYIGNIAAASATAGVADMIVVRIANYRDTAFQKCARYENTLKTGVTNAANLYSESGSNWWRSAAAVQSIAVFPSSNAFVDGTVISLLGRY